MVSAHRSSKTTARPNASTNSTRRVNPTDFSHDRTSADAASSGALAKMQLHPTEGTPWRTHWARRRDPRILVLFLLAMNIIGFSNAALIVTNICLVIIALSLFISASRRVIIIWLLFIALNLGLFYGIPYVLGTFAGASLMFLGFWMLRFAIAIGTTIAVFSVIDLQRLSAVLNQMHAPAWFAVTAQVMIRFFPVAISEAKTIHNAMVLRDLNADSKSLMFHPLRTGEYLLVPLLAVSARITDELSAAAMLRGVGSPGPASSTINSKFDIGDFAVAILLLAVVALWVVTKI